MKHNPIHHSLTVSSPELGESMKVVLDNLKIVNTLKEKGKYLAMLRNYLHSMAKLYNIKLPAQYKIISFSQSFNLETHDNLFHFYYEEIQNETSA